MEHLARISIQLPTSARRARYSAPSRSASWRLRRERRGVVPRRVAPVRWPERWRAPARTTCKHTSHGA
jgi:hypothetical protein